MTALDAMLSPSRMTRVKRLQFSEKTAYWAIILFAIVLRFAQLDAQSLTMDEVKDLEIARGGWTAIQNSEDRFPPLYHLLLGGWLKIMPWDETGRDFSALCGVLTVAVLMQLGAIAGGSRAGLWTGAIAAVAPFMTWYSVESRVYGLYLLLAATSLWQFTAANEAGPRRHWSLFAAAAITGVYVHYYFGLLIACEGLLFLWGRPQGAELRRGLLAFTVIAIGCIPAWFLLQADLDQPWGYAKTSDFSAAALPYTYFSYLSGYTLGPSLRELHAMPAGAAALAAAPWAISLGSAAAVLLGLAWIAMRGKQRGDWLAWFTAFCLVPPAIIGAVSSFANFGYNARHAVWACLPLYVLMGVGMASGQRRSLRITAIAVLALGFAVAHFNRQTSDVHRNEDLRAAARFIATFEETAPIFVLSGYMSKPLAVYLPEENAPHPLPDAGVDAPSSNEAMKQASDLIRSHVRPGEVFWLVYSREFHGDPRGTMLFSLKEQFALQPQHTFAGVQLFLGTAK